MDTPFKMNPHFFHNAINGIFGNCLDTYHFEYIKDHKWVNSDDNRFRRIISLYKLKSAIYVPAWGFSLDFCPHVNQDSKVIWHNDAQTSITDLRYDIVDYEKPFSDWGISYGYAYQTEEDFMKRVEFIARKVLEAAGSYFARVRSYEDLLKLYEEAVNYKQYKRFGFENYPQQVISYAFLLKYLGKENEAENWLQKAFTQYRYSNNIQKQLREAFNLLQDKITP